MSDTDICQCWCHSTPDHCESCDNDYADLCEAPPEWVETSLANPVRWRHLTEEEDEFEW